jgi:type I restriction enzyme S subunit
VDSTVALEVSDQPDVDGWIGVKLGDIAEVSAGGSAPQGQMYFAGGTNRFVRMQHVDEGAGLVRRWDYITDEAVQENRLRLFPKGTILVPKSGASIRLEKRGILAEDAYVVSHLATVIARHDLVDNDFLFFKLASMRFSDEKADGYPTLGIGEIREVGFLLPPLKEQQAIASVLRTVRRAQDSTEVVLAATRDVRRSLMRTLFTNGAIGAGGGVQLKETEIGPLPNHWEAVPFGSLLTSGTQNGVYKPRSAYGGGSPIVDMTDIFRGDVLRSVAERLSLSASEIGKYGLREGDLLFARRSFKPEGAGKCQLVPALDESIVFSSSIIRTSPDPSKVDSTFLLYFFGSPAGRNVVGQIVRHLAVSGISGGDLRKVIVPLPPLLEQRAIAGVLRAVDAKLDAEERRQEALMTLSQSLIHELMTGARRLTQEVD